MLAYANCAPKGVSRLERRASGTPFMPVDGHVTPGNRRHGLRHCSELPLSMGTTRESSQTKPLSHGSGLGWWSW